MCGIVGSVGFLSLRGKRMMEDLRVINAVRGLNGCGTAFINAQQHVHLIKGLETPQELSMLPQYVKAEKRSNICVIAHSRAATMGEINEENCHPFKFKNVVGCHNGTIFEHSRQYLYNNDKYETDSEAIMATMDKYGARKGWNYIQGAASLVFWDKREKGLCMIKNSQRPLSFAFLDVEGKADSGKVMIYSSEYDMLSFVSKRHSISISQIYTPRVDNLLIFKFSSKKQKVTYSVEAVKPFAWLDHNPAIVPEKKFLPTVINGKFSSAIYYKNMTEKQWQDDYHTCLDCGCSLLSEYKTGVMIDEGIGVCGLCALGTVNPSQKQIPWRH